VKTNVGNRIRYCDTKDRHKEFNLRTEFSEDFAPEIRQWFMIYVKCSSGFRNIGERCGKIYGSAPFALCHGLIAYKLEETMIRLITLAFALTLATSAQAMPVPKLAVSDGLVTHVAQACGAGMRRAGGVCVSRAGVRQTRRAVRRTARRCARWSAGTCLRYY
jgi:hypothetical protein